jgi:hypothetical protein
MAYRQGHSGAAAALAGDAVRCNRTLLSGSRWARKVAGQWEGVTPPAAVVPVGAFDLDSWPAGRTYAVSVEPTLDQVSGLKEELAGQSGDGQPLGEGPPVRA